MLIGDGNGSDGGDKVMVPGPDFVSNSIQMNVTDAHLIAFGGDTVTASGHAVVTALLDCDPTACYDDTARTALLYLTGTSIHFIAADDNKKQAPGGPSVFSEIHHPVANSRGDVYFKAEIDNTNFDEPFDSAIIHWTKNEGWSEAVRTGDPVLGIKNNGFDGFPPHFDTNEAGTLAFVAGLDLHSDCDYDAFDDTDYEGPGDGCQGVYVKFRDGDPIEVARSTNAKSLGGGPTRDSYAGFSFLGFGAVAVASDNGTVFFTAANQDDAGECEFTKYGADEKLGGGDEMVSGVFAVTEDLSMSKIIAEGDQVPEGQIMRLFLPMPELRQHADDNRFAVRAWLDTDDDCLADHEVSYLLNQIAFPIPALGPWGMWLMAAMVSLFGAAVLMRRSG